METLTGRLRRKDADLYASLQSYQPEYFMATWRLTYPEDFTDTKADLTDPAALAAQVIIPDVAAPSDDDSTPAPKDEHADER